MAVSPPARVAAASKASPAVRAARSASAFCPREIPPKLQCLRRRRSKVRIETLRVPATRAQRQLGLEDLHDLGPIRVSQIEYTRLAPCDLVEPPKCIPRIARLARDVKFEQDRLGTLEPPLIVN